MVVETLGHLVAVPVPLSNEQKRAQGAQWAAQVQAVTGAAVHRGVCRSRVHGGATGTGRRCPRALARSGEVV
jgi:hypothetical protein